MKIVFREILGPLRNLEVHWLSVKNYFFLSLENILVSFKLPKGQTRISKDEKTSQSHQKVFRIYENNWDLKTINKLSKNCSRWLVYEVMRGQKGEYRDKLKKNYQDNFGTTMSTTELLPEAISETDLNDFYKVIIFSNFSISHGILGLSRIRDWPWAPQSDGFWTSRIGFRTLNPTRPSG